ncbi:hypothetical protein MNBD_GAMMA12-1977 [hydrothermal vent metagenome]|uniref:3-oxoacyl-[acyl-carrier-protein] reductase n=1 Tax=hydrothermal vent metagenome TaxID=652676 RepID=A0A3B0YZ30_9ZZZZ
MAQLRCLVLGGTGSIGSSVCQRLSEENCSFVFSYYQNKTKAESLKNSLLVKAALACDFREFKQTTQVIAQAAELLGGLDCLIQCVGISGDKKFYSGLTNRSTHTDHITQDDIDDAYQVNTRGTFNACQAAFEVMRTGKGGGNIIVLGSMDGVKAVPSPVHFAMSKAALKGLVESMAKVLGQYDIRINLLAPGIVNGGASDVLNDSVKDSYLKYCSLGRFAEPEEIAEMAVWLGLENTYITGQSILLDGGL